MGRPDIKNLNDLNDYLKLLEDRIAVLEQEDRTIKGAINEVNYGFLDTKIENSLFMKWSI